MNNTIQLPFYAKVSLIVIGLFVFVEILFMTQDIIVPLVYATIFAIVLSPAVDFLVKKNINKIVAISLVLGLLTVATIFLFVLFSAQVFQFGDSFPALTKNLDQLLQQFIGWFSENLHISTTKINAWIVEKNAAAMEQSTVYIGRTIMNTGSILVALLLIPVYIFMILLYKSLLIAFIHQLFGVEKHQEVTKVLTATKGIIQSYLIGILIEALIVAVLNSSVLLLLGVQYAILLGIIGAIMNIIPYVGNIIAVLLPILIALATKSPEYTLYIIIGYAAIQFIDNNIISPNIVASKVQINALVSVIVVVIGGALWGLSGMFLAIPLTAISKVIFDHVQVLKPLGFLLGDIVPTVSRIPFVKRRKPQV